MGLEVGLLDGREMEMCCLMFAGFVRCIWEVFVVYVLEEMDLGWA